MVMSSYVRRWLFWKDITLIPSRRKTLNYSNVGVVDTLSQDQGSGCQQHSNNRSSMMYGSDLAFIYVIFTNFGRNMAGNFRNTSLLIVCSVETNSSIAFLLLHKSSIVNEVPNENDDFECLNPVSSWRCGL
jgi:hypothetical protein